MTHFIGFGHLILKDKASIAMYVVIFNLRQHFSGFEDSQLSEGNLKASPARLGRYDIHLFHSLYVASCTYVYMGIDWI